MQIKQLPLLVAVMMFLGVVAGFNLPADAPATGSSSAPVETAVIRGIVSDAVDPSVRLGEAGVRIGTVSCNVDDDGEFLLEVGPGTHTVQVSCKGYITATITVEAQAGQSVRVDIPMSREMAADQYRIVLTWGEVPADLDAHLLGQRNGRNYHVYYAERKPSAAEGTATLDVDDTTGFGPETVTMTVDADSQYIFYVADYSNRSGSAATALSASGARVEVYRGTEHIHTFNAPEGQSGNIWTVFSIRGGELIPENEISPFAPVLGR